MKKLFWIFCLGIVVLFGAGQAIAEKAPQEVYDMAKDVLAPVGAETVIVEAVKTENAKGKTLEQIQEMDKKWQETAGVADFMKALQDNDCGKFLKDFQNKYDYIAEIFVMDGQGANVAMTDKTSDYWQGDEAKFKNSFKDGQGEIFVDEVEFDESTQAYLVQVSVPVMDGGKAIGAITFGIDLDQLK